MELLALLAFPALAGGGLFLVPKRWLAITTILIPAITFVYLLSQFSLVTTGVISRFDLEWVPSFNVNISLALDGLAYLFTLIISGIGTLVLIYANSYFEKAEEFVRFASYTLVFMSAMLGIVLSDNLLLLFVFWEITTVTSYLLIGFKHEKSAARAGARRALLITGGGGLAMMGGFLMLGQITGTFQISEIVQQADVIQNSPLYLPMLVLILLGAFTKSAQFPFHFWLPGAMEAPTPASTYLHSATMVKAGVFLLARLSPALNGTPAWTWILTIVGLFTFVYAAFVALRHTDLKAILAYSTVSWLGALVAMQGTASEAAGSALIVGIIAHALYKAALFLVTGSIDHATGTRQIPSLGNLARLMPFTFIGALIALISMSGFPPVLGFLAKELLKYTSLETTQPDALRILFMVAAIAGSALTVAVALRILKDAFFGDVEIPPPHEPHEVSPFLWGAPLILGIGTISLAFLLPQVLDPLVSAAITAIRLEPVSVHLHLFEGVTPALIMSVIAIVIGFGIFLVRMPLMNFIRHYPEGNPAIIYEWLFFTALTDTAKWVTSHLQNGRLRYYMTNIFLAFIAAVAGVMLIANIDPIPDDLLAGFDPLIAAFCALLIVGAIAGVIAPGRLSAIAVLSIEGALLALLFAFFGAPDLALTQLMIEVVTLVLFILAFHFLPDAFVSRMKPKRKFIDLGIAVASGATVTVLILAAGNNRISPSISDWYLDNSLGLAHGANVVNVLLVDFRGMDTMVEITVLAIAAAGAVALLRLRPSGQPRGRFVIVEAEPSTEPLPPPEPLVTDDDDAALKDEILMEDEFDESSEDEEEKDDEEETVSDEEAVTELETKEDTP